MPHSTSGTGCEVVTRQDFSDVTYLLEVRHPMMARAARPGQFVIVMSHPHGERIPLTIADFDRSKGTITLVVQAVGKTTREMQRDCRVGTRLHALVGPMGIPSLIGRRRKVQACLLHMVNIMPQRLDGLLYIEVLGALAVTFSTVAESALKECEFETFHYNRSKILEMLGITSGYLNRLQPTVEQLEEASVIEVAH
jgi:hypothetical protein